MNFLQLVNTARGECGVSGGVLASVQNPTSTEALRFINWVAQSWVEIQTKQTSWQFLRVPVAFSTAQQGGAATYANAYTPAQAGLSGGVASWIVSSFRCYRPAFGVTDEMILNYLTYDDFRDLYLYGANRNIVARPVAFTIDPLKNFLVGPTPDGVYLINGEAYIPPQILSGDTDTPIMPAQFHYAIVYKTMQKYAGFESAPEVLQRANAELSAIMGNLAADQLPQMGFGGPLA